MRSGEGSRATAPETYRSTLLAHETGTVLVMGVTGNFYRLLLLLHIACAILGFGSVAFNGLYRARARQRGGPTELAILQETSYVGRIAEFLIYAVFILGILVAVTSKSPGAAKPMWELKQAWLSAAMVLYLADIGLLHAFIHKAERRYAALLVEVNGAGSASPGAGVSQLEQLESRIRLGWTGFDVIFLVVLYLMVFKPGL